MVQLTTVDRDEKYSEETLAEALAADHSGRHTARIAHLYFDRTKFLTDKDYKVELPELFSRIFGTIDGNGQLLDHGWLGKSQNIPGSPTSLAQSLQKDLENTFDTKKWSREQLAAFRVFQLLDPGDQGNLFEVIFERENRARYIYYMRKEVFPNHLTAILPAYLQSGGRDAHLTLGGRGSGLQFYETLSVATSPVSYTPENINESIALSLEELYVFRFVNWFALYSSENSRSTGASAGSQTSTSQSTGPMHSKSISGAGKKSLTGPSRRTGYVLYLSQRHTLDMINNNPPLELFRRYLERMVPHDTSKMMYNEKLFFSTIIHLWLLRNVELSAPSLQQNLSGNYLTNGTMVVARPQYGSMTYSASTPPAPQQAFLAPSSTLLQALTIFFVHICADKNLCPGYPASKSSMGQSTSSALVVSNVGISSCQGMLKTGEPGLTPYLRAIRCPVYQFFVTTLQRVDKLPNSTSAGLLNTMDLWLSYLQPWRAAWRWEPKQTETHNSMQNMFNTFVHARREEPTTGRTGPRSSQGQSANDANKVASQAKPVSENFEPQWMWFVIQNYLTYSHVLQIVIARLQETSLSEPDRRMIERAFHASGAFSDAVVCILRSCEIIIEDEVLEQPARPLRDELAASYHHLGYIANPEILDAKRRGEVQDLLTIVDCMHEHRKDIYSILSQHMKELDWHVEERAIPALLDSRPAMQIILNQINSLSAQEKKSSGYMPSGNLGRFIYSQGTGDKEQEKIPNATERENTVRRMHNVFNVPQPKRQTGGLSKGTSDQSFAKSAPLDAPESRLMLASPQWLGEQVTCVYRRLTALGRLQMDSGRRICGTQEMRYVGDPLVNPPPVCSYEIAWLVRLTFSLSKSLNKLFDLDHVTYDMDEQGDGEWKQSQFRFNLRFMADARNMLFFAIVVVLCNAVFFQFPLAFPYILAMLLSPLSVLLGPDSIGEYGALLIWPFAVMIQLVRYSGLDETTGGEF